MHHLRQAPQQLLVTMTTQDLLYQMFTLEKMPMASGLLEHYALAQLRSKSVPFAHQLLQETGAQLRVPLS
jgi:hypothetical protein